jgi:hypothetical protein
MASLQTLQRSTRIVPLRDSDGFLAGVNLTRFRAIRVVDSPYEGFDGIAVVEAAGDDRD